MFSRNFKTNRSQDISPMLALPAPSEAPGPAKSQISADIVINGDISTGGEILIDGTIAGNLRAARVTVGKTATIRGDVTAEEVIVRGHVVGTILGRRVQLSSSSYVVGDIYHQSMGMEMGARLDGCCRHTADPLAIEAPAAAPVVQKPVSLARAAFKTEDRSVVPNAAPAVDPPPAEPHITAAVSVASLKEGRPSLARAASSSSEAGMSAELAKPAAGDLETLKTTGLKMRARTPKPLPGKKLSKTDGPDSLLSEPAIAEEPVPTLAAAAG